jgi:hypothetical protein
MTMEPPKNGQFTNHDSSAFKSSVPACAWPVSQSNVRIYVEASQEFLDPKSAPFFHPKN